MTREEYNQLFHKENLNLVAFKMVNDCDKEILRLVNAAIAAEREAIAQMVEPWLLHEYVEKIRARGTHD